MLATQLSMLEEMVHSKEEFTMTDSEFAFGWHFFVLIVHGIEAVYCQAAAQYWTLFGDPSLMVRTDEPSNMNIVHDDVVLVGQSQFIINTGLSGSLAALSLDGELLSSGYANQFGAITLNLEGATDIPGVFDLVITGFNAITYDSEITVLAPEGPYITMDAFTGEVMHGMQNELSIDTVRVINLHYLKFPTQNVTVIRITPCYWVL